MRLLVPCLVSSFLMGAASAQEPVSIFRPLGLDEAKLVAKEQGRLLVVDFTASWCVPCKRMETTTWIDARLGKWFEKRAVAIQIDIDEHEKVARQLGVRSVPVVVVYRGDDEFDRKGGYQGADELIAWLEGVEKDQRAIDALMVHAESTKVGPRAKLAKALLEGRRLEEALAQYLWLWNHALEHARSYRAVRLSYWAAQIGELCRCYPPARAAFEELRDQAFEKWSADLDANRTAADDWVALNDHLRNREQILQWYELVRENPKWSRSLQELRIDVYEAYLERGDHAAAGRVYFWPGGLAHQFARGRASGLERAGEDRERVRAVTEQYRVDIAKLYAATLAAGKDPHAAQLASDAFAIDSEHSIRIALVRAALIARQPRASHRVWLDQARSGGEPAVELRRELEIALKKN